MHKLSIIGVGKMGTAILNGIINQGLYTKDDILLVVRREEQKHELEAMGYNVTLKVCDAYFNSEILLLAVKPQMFPIVFEDALRFDFTDRTIISIAAGVTIKRIESMFKNADVVRAMPNTAAMINNSVTTLCGLHNEGYEVARNIFSSIGTVIEIDECELDATIPLNGSMPAYLYSFIMEFIDNAENSGIPYEKAKDMICDTIIGSTKMLKNSKKLIDDEINAVCSKGGTTVAGLDKLYENGFRKSITECYEACVKRSKELNK